MKTLTFAKMPEIQNQLQRCFLLLTTGKQLKKDSFSTADAFHFLNLTVISCENQVNQKPFS